MQDKLRLPLTFCIPVLALLLGVVKVDSAAC